MWHIPRTQDTTVQTIIRGLPETAHGDRWAHWNSLRRLGSGVGIRLEEADEIARCVQRAEVMAYADDVHQAQLAWLSAIDEGELDRITGARLHLSRFLEYQTPRFVEWVHGLLDPPIGSLLMRSYIGHIHRHLGELEAAKNILRSQK